MGIRRGGGGGGGKGEEFVVVKEADGAVGGANGQEGAL